MTRRTVRWTLAAALALVAAAPAAAPTATAAPDPTGGFLWEPHEDDHMGRNDANSGQDAGDTFATATPVDPKGRYNGRLADGHGDTDDYFRFPVPQGGSLSVIVQFDELLTDPVELLDPDGNVIDTGVGVVANGVSFSNTMTSESEGVRVAVHHALKAGQYRLHVGSKHGHVTNYSLCFMNCDQPQRTPIEMIFGGSLDSPKTSVLLIPPSHGDLGNPGGPTVTEYIDATLRGIRRWEEGLRAFAADYPDYGYLAQIDLDVEVFDEANPVDPVGYDIVLAYAAAGPAFRGVASGSPGGPLMSGDVHFSGRFIVLSLYGSSPRAGQVHYDFPELNDLEWVTMHEFGHTFGLGHTTTWHPELGPDLMNSPAPFIYGDGSPAGDGGERTSRPCFSSLDLYGMAYLYRWLPSQQPERSYGWVDLPEHIPYKPYC